MNRIDEELVVALKDARAALERHFRPEGRLMKQIDAAIAKASGPDIPHAIPHALCLRAQYQTRQATEAVRPKFSPKYGRDHPPISGVNAPARAFCDVLTRRVYLPEDGWLTMEEHRARS